MGRTRANGPDLVVYASRSIHVFATVPHDSVLVTSLIPAHPDRVASEVRLIASLDHPARTHLADTLGALDYPVSRASSARALIDSHLAGAPRFSWGIYRSGEPVGVFALPPYRDRPGAAKTSTYLAPWARGTGLNLALKRATVLAARASGLDVYSSIAEGNRRSLAAASKLFVSYEPALVFEPHAERMAWIFDLTDRAAELTPGPVSTALMDALSHTLSNVSLKAA